MARQSKTMKKARSRYSGEFKAEAPGLAEKVGAPFGRLRTFVEA